MVQEYVKNTQRSLKYVFHIYIASENALGERICMKWDFVHSCFFLPSFANKANTYKTQFRHHEMFTHYTQRHTITKYFHANHFTHTGQVEKLAHQAA